MHLGLNPTDPVFYWASSRGRTNRKGDQASVFRYWSHSMTTFRIAAAQQKLNFSLLKPSNQIACGIKRLKISNFVIPRPLKGILTKGCRSPEEWTMSIKNWHEEFARQHWRTCQDQSSSASSWELSSRAARTIGNSLQKLFQHFRLPRTRPHSGIFSLHT